MIAIETIKQWIKEEKIFNLKYVKVDGQYRFCGLYEEHTSLVQMADHPTSAGIISYAGYPEGLRVEGESMKLRIGHAKDDFANIKKLFGLDNSFQSVIL